MTKQNLNFAELFFHKTFLIRRKLQVLETCRKSSPKFRRFFIQSVNTVKIYNFFQEKSSPKRSSGHVECNFDNSPEFFLPKIRHVFAQSPKMTKTFLFSAEIIFHKTFLMRRKLQVWETWRKSLPKVRNVYAQIFETRKYIFYLEKKFLKTFIRTRRMQFWQLCRRSVCQMSKSFVLKVWKP